RRRRPPDTRVWPACPSAPLTGNDRTLQPRSRRRLRRRPQDTRVWPACPSAPLTGNDRTLQPRSRRRLRRRPQDTRVWPACPSAPLTQTGRIFTGALGLLLLAVAAAVAGCGRAQPPAALNEAARTTPHVHDGQ